MMWVFLRKELSEFVRTWKVYVFPLMMVFFAVVSPLTARYLNEIMAASLPAGAAKPALPPPSADFAWGQWIKNQQTVTLAILLTYGGIMSDEVRRGSAALVLTKPLSRTSFVVAKIIASMATLIVSTVVGTLVCWGVALVLFDDVNPARLLVATAAWLLQTALVVAFVIMCSARWSSGVAAAGAGLGLLAAMALASLWKPLRDYTPVGIGEVVDKLLGEGQVAWAWPVWTTLALTVVFWLMSVLAFRRREL